MSRPGCLKHQSGQKPHTTKQILKRKGRGNPTPRQPPSWNLWSLYFLLDWQQRHSQLQYIKKWGKWHQMTFSTQGMSNNVKGGYSLLPLQTLAWHLCHRNSDPATSNKCHPKPNLLQSGPHSAETWEGGGQQNPQKSHLVCTFGTPHRHHTEYLWVPTSKLSFFAKYLTSFTWTPMAAVTTLVNRKALETKGNDVEEMNTIDIWTQTDSAFS